MGRRPALSSDWQYPIKIIHADVIAKRGGIRLLSGDPPDTLKHLVGKNAEVIITPFSQVS